jgi:hypothetical protein
MHQYMFNYLLTIVLNYKNGVVCVCMCEKERERENILYDNISKADKKLSQDKSVQKSHRGRIQINFKSRNM